MIFAAIFAPNMVYTMRPTAIKHKGKVKIGVSTIPRLRAKQVSASIKGDAVVVVSMRVFFAYQVEAFLHLMFSSIHTKMEGSGKTEWFKAALSWVVAVATAFALSYRFGHIVPHGIHLPNQVQIIQLIAASIFGAFVINTLVSTAFHVLVFILLLAVRLLQESIILAVIYYTLQNFAK